MNRNSQEAKMHIDELKQVSLNGIHQWIYVRSQNKENPILLFLHGGPGFPGIGVAESFQAELENRFTVVQWDQRGAGKSYSPTIPPESMTIQQFISDVAALINYLNRTINKQKIYLAGHSWGAMLGMLAAKQYPELFQYVISIGQSINLQLTLEARIPFLLDEAQKRGDAEVPQKIEAAKQNGFGELFQTQYDYVMKYGGGFYGRSDGNLLFEIISSKCTLYSDAEKMSIGKGMEFSGLLYQDIFAVNLMEQVTKIEVPVLFISGKSDMLCPRELTTKYYEILEAPSKQIIYFEKSAHFPFLEETEKFCDVVNRL
jgi:pimeloyl-ACP methyl ester carboxylesterase